LKTSPRAFGTLSLDGSACTRCLEKVTSADVSNAAFPFGHVREIDIAGAAVRALRVTYVGELGWELHIPIDAIGEVFDALMHAGKTMGYPPGRLPGTGIARLEKGYRAWGSDITPNDTPLKPAWAGPSGATQTRPLSVRRRSTQSLVNP
jgi:sarcosine dehydrogenase